MSTPEFEVGEFVVAVEPYETARILQLARIYGGVRGSGCDADLIPMARVVNIETGRQSSIQMHRLTKATGSRRFRRIGHGLDALREAGDCMVSDRLTVEALGTLRRLVTT